MKDADRLPYWPATLNKGMAAAYCGLSYELFRKLCPVKPIAFTDSAKGERYLRLRLDEWLLSLDQNTPFCTTYATNEVEPGSWKTASNQIAEPRNGAGGYPIIDDPKHPVNVFYESLGFDPETMNEDDMRRLRAKAHEEWTAGIPGTKLGKREIKALKYLASIGPAIKIHWRDVKDCGPDTEERLKIRGFIETFPQEDYPDRIGYYMLTDEGFAASQESGT
ncbi:hypothetical protein [Rhizobium leguminosarum]|uniref:hypothetical protein n=1 Tax=Rhizobium leguminosarum TaxID=384 RepID=UPI003F95966A